MAVAPDTDSDPDSDPDTGRMTDVPLVQSADRTEGLRLPQPAKSPLTLHSLYTPLRRVAVLDGINKSEYRPAPAKKLTRHTLVRVLYNIGTKTTGRPSQWGADEKIRQQISYSLARRRCQY